jgi:hypothetical protein
MPTYEIIDGVAIDLSVKTLMHTFLSAYFDGESHDLGTRTGIPFPRAGIAFDQGLVAQPLQGNPPAADGGLEIRVIFDGGRMERHAAGTGWQVLHDGTLQFWVRSKILAPDLKLNSKHQAQNAGDLVFDLLNNPIATIDLAGAGITRFRPRKPMVKQSADHAVRLVVCPVLLVYNTTF